MIIAQHAEKVRRANESFYGSLQNPNRQNRISAADAVVVALNNYVDALDENPHELHAQYERQQHED
jgi:hypothetical protein